MSSKIVASLLMGLVLLSVACDSTPQEYECRFDAQQAIKRHLAFPSTFDEHGLDTTSWAADRAIITGDKESGWTIRTAIIFGTKNAFGVQTDYFVRYEGRVNTDGECTGVTLGDFVPYRR